MDKYSSFSAQKHVNERRRMKTACPFQLDAISSSLYYKSYCATTHHVDTNSSSRASVRCHLHVSLTTQLQGEIDVLVGKLHKYSLCPMTRRIYPGLAGMYSAEQTVG